jgi:hypothetical protein
LPEHFADFAAELFVLKQLATDWQLLKASYVGGAA